MHDIETIIVGAGAVGLAIARSLSLAGHEVIVLERHGIIGSETSARNSEVIHAGIYYPKGSLKASTCIEGKKLLYDFCHTHGVPHKKIGKIIVATNENQMKALNDIHDHARRNGVSDLQPLDETGLAALEPNLNGMAGLLSPSTGIIDSHAYMLALQGDAESLGCQFAFNTSLESWRKLTSGGFELTTGEGTIITARNLIISSGLQASSTINSNTVDSWADTPHLKYAKGNYFRLVGKAPFSKLIYPVPEPGGLGVHLTLDMGGQARFGPDVEWVEQLDYEVDPTRGDNFYAAIRDYWPDLAYGALEADYCGIRPKLSGAGEPNVDFKIWGPKDHGRAGFVALLGIESPGLTASLALAEHVKRTLSPQSSG